MAKTKTELSPKAKEILEFIKESDRPLTQAEIAESVEGVNSAHLTALKNRGLVTAEKIEKIVVTESKRKVNEYTAVALEEKDAE